MHPLAQVKWFETLWPVKASGGVMTPELYLSLMTLHGTLMVFFVLTLAPLNAFGNLVLPEQLGAKSMAFPRLNAFSYWVYLFGSLFIHTNSQQTASDERTQGEVRSKN